jgi:hypothetical protein
VRRAAGETLAPVLLLHRAGRQVGMRLARRRAADPLWSCTIGHGSLVSLFACSSIVAAVSRPTRFEHFQYLGDKRNQVVYDLDLADGDEAVSAAIDELMKSEQFAAFGPDTLAEARNRGYRPHRSIKSTRS